MIRSYIYGSKEKRTEHVSCPNYAQFILRKDYLYTFNFSKPQAFQFALKTKLLRSIC